MNFLSESETGLRLNGNRALLVCLCLCPLLLLVGCVFENQPPLEPLYQGEREFETAVIHAAAVEEDPRLAAPLIELIRDELASETKQPELASGMKTRRFYRLHAAIQALGDRGESCGLKVLEEVVAAEGESELGLLAQQAIARIQSSQ